jgi:DNA repair and recombination protein RAD52
MEQRDANAPCPRRLGPDKVGTSNQRPGLPSDVHTLLAEPLDPSLVAERRGPHGQAVRYLEGWVAISQANRIFGFDGWGTEIVGEVGYRPLFGDNLGMYTATVRLTVRGWPPHADVGCALVKEPTAEAHESAYKGAVTDALKRALRHFGDQYGNSLYQRRNGNEPVGNLERDAAVDSREAARRKLVELSRRLGASEEKTRSSLQNRYGRELEELTSEELAEAIHALTEALNKRRSARSTKAA